MKRSRWQRFLAESCPTFALACGAIACRPHVDEPVMEKKAEANEEQAGIELPVGPDKPLPVKDNGIFEIEAGMASMTGQRELNEDSACFLSFDLKSERYEHFQVSLAMVCDGMGGHARGDWASQTCVSEVTKSLCTGLVELNHPDSLEYLLTHAQKDANFRIYNSQDDVDSSAGTTSVAILAVQSPSMGETLLLANVGDSRAYKIKDGIRQLTTDHSLVEELVRNGEITREEARIHPQRNVITQAVGTAPDVKVDIVRLKFQECSLLLCSDGLHGCLGEEEIARFIGRYPPQEAAEKMVKHVQYGGGDDNITAVVLKIKEQREVNDGEEIPKFMLS